MVVIMEKDTTQVTPPAGSGASPANAKGRIIDG